MAEALGEGVVFVPGVPGAPEPVLAVEVGLVPADEPGAGAGGIVSFIPGRIVGSARLFVWAIRVVRSWFDLP